MGSLTNRSGGFFEDFFKDLPGLYIRPLRGEGPQDQGQIRIDVKDEEQAYTVRADVPGVAKDDIQVMVDGHSVTIRAEVKQEETEKQQDWLRSERYCGVCSRSFSLPTPIDETQAKAQYSDGVLTLTLPKAQGSQQKRLTIE